MDLNALGRCDRILDWSTHLSCWLGIFFSRNVNLIPSEVHHELIPVDLFEIHAGHVGVIERRGAADALDDTDMASTQSRPKAVPGDLGWKTPTMPRQWAGGELNVRLCGGGEDEEG